MTADEMPTNLIINVAFATFVASIFYGDIYVGITVPLAILLLAPLGITAFVKSGLPTLMPVAPVRFLVSFLILVPTLQFMAGTPPTRFDLGAYLPIMYAAIAFQVMAFLPVSTRAASYGLFCGVLLLGVLLGYSIVLDQPEREVIPGQNLQRTEARLKETFAQKNEASDAARQDQQTIEHHPGIPPSGSSQMTVRARVSTVSAVKKNEASDAARQDQQTIEHHPGIPPSEGSSQMTVRARESTVSAVASIDDDSTRRFYRYKQSLVIPLGSSNYLAVFCLFVFTVAVFLGRYVMAAVSAALIGLTMSRFGLVLMALPISVLAIEEIRAHHKGSLFTWVAIAVIPLAIAVLYLSGLHNLGLQSLTVRQAIAASAFPVIIDHPLTGLPRSLIVLTWGYAANWHPHNMILWLLASSGIIGTILYVSYLITLGRAVWLLQSDRFWLGVFVAMVTTLIFSMVEIVSPTPAIDLLIASLGGIAFQQVAARRFATTGRQSCRKTDLGPPNWTILS